jgi:hypothetical protein
MTSSRKAKVDTQPGQPTGDDAADNPDQKMHKMMPPQ